MPETEMISLPKNLVAGIMHVLAGLPAGQVARMLIALDDAMNPKPFQIAEAGTSGEQEGAKDN